MSQISEGKPDIQNPKEKSDIQNSKEKSDSTPRLPNELIELRTNDLFYSNHSRASKYHHGTWAYFSYILRVIDYLFVAIYLDWTIIFRHPLNFILIISFFSITTCLLFLFGLVLMIIPFSDDDSTIISRWKKVLGKYYKFQLLYMQCNNLVIS